MNNQVIDRSTLLRSQMKDNKGMNEGGKMRGRNNRNDLLRLSMTDYAMSVRSGSEYSGLNQYQGPGRTSGISRNNIQQYQALSRQQQLGVSQTSRTFSKAAFAAAEQRAKLIESQHQQSVKGGSEYHFPSKQRQHTTPSPALQNSHRMIQRGTSEKPNQPATQPIKPEKPRRGPEFSESVIQQNKLKNMQADSSHQQASQQRERTMTFAKMGSKGSPANGKPSEDNIADYITSKAISQTERAKAKTT